jgi:predicted DNA-binding protein
MNKTRNFALHITPGQKQTLKRLAENSGMTLTKYVEEVLNSAVQDRATFQTRTERISVAKKGKVPAGVS